MGDQRRRRGVADAHFAETDNIATLRRQLSDDRRTASHRLGALGRAHRRLFQVIGGAAGDFCVNKAVDRSKVMGDAGIDDSQRNPVVPAEDVDRRAAIEEIADHLPGHILRKGRNAGPGRAVIAGKDQHLRLLQHRRQRLLQQPDAHGERFQLAERAERLGLAVDLVFERFFNGPVRGRNTERMHPILQKKKGFATAFGQRSREALSTGLLSWCSIGLLAFGSSGSLRLPAGSVSPWQ